MQVTAPTRDALRQEIHDAFDGVAIPTQIDDMLLSRYSTSEDAYEMAATFVGRPWAALSISELFRHREMLATLSATAYRAYVAAYLMACLESDDWSDHYGADLRGYLVSGLKVWPHQNPSIAPSTQERLSLLDPRQRAAIGSVLRYLEERWRMRDAAELLREWSSSSE
jgi:hypothetical protein